MARQYMEVFFADKEFYCGGSIPQKILYSPSYITQVLNTDISHGVKQAYKILDDHDGISSVEEDEKISEDIRLILAVLKQCEDLRVPKVFAGGIMLVYLEVCEGVGA